MKFIRKLNKITGKKFRLPTESEWEYAARGGKLSKGYNYAGSNNIDDIAWYNENSDNTIHEVDQKFANELNLFDMSGNVSELCQDFFGPYSGDSWTNPTGPVDGHLHVERGGDWCNSTSNCWVWNRSYFTEGAYIGGSYATIGFRLVM